MLKNYTKEGFSHRIEKIDEKSGSTEKFRVSVRIPMLYGWIERVRIRFQGPYNEKTFGLVFEMKDDDYAYFGGVVQLERCSLYHYYFSFEGNGVFHHYKKEDITGDRTITKAECWKMAVGFSAPDWAKGAVMYHIFCDRFRKHDGSEFKVMPNRTLHESWSETPVIGPDSCGRWNIDFFGGTLKGIEESLDYIKSLGTDIIYLSPIMMSQSNHRYDTADYEIVDPYLGTNEDLRSLCKAVHRKGMHIILDAVFNHTGDDSRYFNRYGSFDSVGAFQSDSSEFYPFYKRHWTNGVDDFSYWWGMENLPVCEGHNPEWRKYILGEGGIIDQWMQMGIDGLRLDVADELYDDFIEGIRVAVHRNKPDGFVLGEVWKNPMRMGRDYISSGRAMDSVMDYQLVDALIRYYKYCDIFKLQEKVNEIVTEYPTDTLNTMMNFTSTHDISRLIEICSSSDFQQYGEWGWNLNPDCNNDWIKNHHLTREEYLHGKDILKSYITALCFMPGMFSIFYGDEVGIQGIGNLLNRGAYPWGRRDKDLLKFFRTITKLRKNNKFLKEADMKLIHVDSDLLMYERISDTKDMLVVVSRSHNDLHYELPEKYKKDGKMVYSLSRSTNEFIAGYGAVIFVR